MGRGLVRGRRRKRGKGGVQHRSFSLGAAALIGAVLAILSSGRAADTEETRAETVCILFSRDVEPYREAVKGFKERINGSGRCRFVELFMPGQDVGELTGKIRDAKADLVLTLGTEASKVTAVHIEDMPVVFAMVANPVDSGVLPRRSYPGQLVAGVTTDVMPKRQFEMLRRLVPGAKRVAVIYCPQYTEVTVKEGEEAAKSLGMELVRFPVEPFRVDKAVDKLAKEPVDAIWTVTDPGVMVPASARLILVFALKNKIPVIGFSHEMVRAGALFGFGIDAEAIGAQAGDVAAAILREGKKPEEFHLLYPEKVSLALNASVAERIGLEFPKEVFAEAKIVYGE